MPDDFLIRAFLGGTAVALASGPLGSFIVWRRMAFFGDALAHSAILGMVAGIIFSINHTMSVAIFAVLFALLLAVMQKRSYFSSDTILAISTQGALAIGIIALTLAAPGQFNLINLLFGDILAVSYSDIIIMYSGALVAIAYISLIWRQLLLTTINEDLAKVEGVNTQQVSFVFMLLVAIIVALAIKIVGVLLVSSLLIIPAAVARVFSKTPERMAIMASLLGILAVMGGIFTSLKLDTPAGPSVVAVLIGMFTIASLLRKY